MPRLITVKKFAMWILSALVLLLVGLAILVWAITFHPAPTQAEPVTCAGQPPRLKAGQTVKILNYNVQFMAGKNYLFFFEMPNDAGPDDRPSPADITQTLAAVARIIQDEAPDIILLQEVDDGAKRTDYEDQLARLLPLLPAEYKCHTSAFYWKAGFVPHPRVMGAAGMKLSIISKYEISAATRHQLALVPADPLTQQFGLKRAIQEARLPIEGEPDLVVLNTHLEAFAQGYDTMQQQVAQVGALLDSLTQAGHPWLIGGDFNLLPPGQYERVSDSQKRFYQPASELQVLYDKYQAIPGPAEINGPDAAEWLTQFPNDPTITAPDKTIDYIFFADTLTLTDGYVRQSDTLTISDHLPLITQFQLP
jgi:endonuclease/exonuclease/phosphatase family metal-dependent hydrolase